MWRDVQLLNSCFIVGCVIHRTLQNSDGVVADKMNAYFGMINSNLNNAHRICEIAFFSVSLNIHTLLRLVIVPKGLFYQFFLC